LLDAKLGIKTIEDLLNHFPQRYEDYSKIKQIDEVKHGEIVTVIGKIIKTNNIFTRRIKIQEILIVGDDSPRFGEAGPRVVPAKLTFFNQPFILQSLKEGMVIAVSGQAEKINNKLQFKSPEYEVIKKTIAVGVEHVQPLQIKNTLVHTGRLIPIYPETRGISSKWLRARIFPLISQIDNLIKETLSPEILKQENLINLVDAYKNVHYPNSHEDLGKANFRLAFEELLTAQLTSISKKKDWEKGKSKPIELKPFEKQISEIIKKLPFTLTDSQSKAIEEIFSDISKTKPMNRLLEGDVGSGKTIVASLAMYLSYLNGFSSAIMCPTEILANQHHDTIMQLLGRYNVPIHLITSSANKVRDSYGFRADDDGYGKKQKSKIKNLDIRENPPEIRKNPGAAIYIGTHALIEDKVNIPNLNLVIIDEQHRFGVGQRGKLTQKGESPHVLTMTATPIPRTIALTFYGNLDLSVLEELPQKKQIKTWVVPKEKRSKAYEWIEKQIKENKSQAFIICPFIEPSETMETVKSAKAEFENLKNVFSNLKLDLLTGKTKALEKNEIMTKFARGEFEILVATPVVEVGIDIERAAIILIEGSERFGLAALHQLRGRVGRRGQTAYCLLFTSESSNPESLKRLKNLENIDNGLKLAEIDLKIRGMGNLFGAEQHGTLEFKKANISDLYMVTKAKHIAEIVSQNPKNFPELQEKLKSSKIETIINN